MALFQCDDFFTVMMKNDFFLPFLSPEHLPLWSYTTLDTQEQLNLNFKASTDLEFLGHPQSKHLYNQRGSEMPLLILKNRPD